MTQYTLTWQHIPCPILPCWPASPFLVQYTLTQSLRRRIVSNWFVGCHFRFYDTRFVRFYLTGFISKRSTEGTDAPRRIATPWFSRNGGRHNQLSQLPEGVVWYVCCHTGDCRSFERLFALECMFAYFKLVIPPFSNSAYDIPPSVLSIALTYPSQARDRLDRVLTYLREKHYYCFWCGTKYQNSDDMSSNCPGKEEDEHD